MLRAPSQAAPALPGGRAVAETPAHAANSAFLGADENVAKKSPGSVLTSAAAKFCCSDKAMFVRARATSAWSVQSSCPTVRAVASCSVAWQRIACCWSACRGDPDKTYFTQNLDWFWFWFGDL